MLEMLQNGYTEIMKLQDGRFLLFWFSVSVAIITLGWMGYTLIRSK